MNSPNDVNNDVGFGIAVSVSGGSGAWHCHPDKEV